MDRLTLATIHGAVRQTIGRIRNVNRGGCGLAAYYLLLGLQAHGVQGRCRVLGSDTKFTVDDARRRLEERGIRRASLPDWLAIGLDLHHVMVEVVLDGGERWLIDSTHSVRIDGRPAQGLWVGAWTLIPGALTVRELKDMVRPIGWNPAFSRRGNIARMKHATSRIFGVIV